MMVRDADPPAEVQISAAIFDTPYAMRLRLVSPMPRAAHFAAATAARATIAFAIL